MKLLFKLKLDPEGHFKGTVVTVGSIQAWFLNARQRFLPLVGSGLSRETARQIQAKVTRFITLRPSQVFLGLVMACALLINGFSGESGMFKLIVPAAFGGPDPDSASVEAVPTSDSQLVLDSKGVLGDESGIPEEFSGYFFVFEDSVAGWANPVSDSLAWVPARDGLITYEVKEGDSAAIIASHFGISLPTILLANNLSNESVLQPGQRLVVLPVSGVLHEVKAGETLDEIGRTYDVSVAKIVGVNNIKDAENLVIGLKLVVPGATPPAVRVAAATGAIRSTLKQVAGFFRAPAAGWNWGKLHAHNAVDIANSCGTPVYAAAAGWIEEAFLGGWNGGYGNKITVRHDANDTKTVYAHLAAVLVSEGAYVNQGDLIGSIGNTGKTHGPTGCHLHFEVHGAANPFARY